VPRDRPIRGPHADLPHSSKENTCKSQVCALLKSRFVKRTLALALAFAFAALVLLAPRTAAAEETTHKTRWELVGAGAAVFGLSYGASVFVAATQSNVTDADRSHFGWMAVPIAGPIVTAATGDLRRDERVTLPALGVVQLIGVGLATAGFVFPRIERSSGASAQVVPTGTGAALVGTF